MAPIAYNAHHRLRALLVRLDTSAMAMLDARHVHRDAANALLHQFVLLALMGII